MELSKYRMAKSSNKKIRKVTLPATIIFCILSLILGIVFGSSSSGPDTESPNSAALEKAQIEISRLKEENATVRSQLVDAQKKLDNAKKNVAAANTSEPNATQSTVDDPNLTDTE